MIEGNDRKMDHLITLMADSPPPSPYQSPKFWSILASIKRYKTTNQPTNGLPQSYYSYTNLKSPVYLYQIIEASVATKTIQYSKNPIPEGRKGASNMLQGQQSFRIQI